jgi:catechol 2,3-dioxygenase
MWGGETSIALRSNQNLAGGTSASPTYASGVLRMGAVHLSVASLARSVDYYENDIGLQVHRRAEDTVTLGTGGEDLLILTEQPGARPADGFAGLFHFALLVPDRTDLARWLVHAARDRVALTGMSDHAFSEALYLRDPDGHGIEIYADRPRELWEGRVDQLMTTMPLDTDALVATLGDPAAATFDGLAAGTVMGHVHFRVSEVHETADFYRELGFDQMAMLGGQSVFLGWNGYHHHVGANTWESRGAPQAPEDRARLLKATILTDGETGSLTDPSGNVVELTSAGSGGQARP